MIGIQDLQIALEVARQGTLRGAAQAVGLSQPALTHCLKKIELDVGYEIFVRSKSGMRPSSEGQRFLIQIERVLSEWSKISQKHEGATLRPIFRIGMHPSVARYTVNKSWREFLKHHWELELRFTHDLSRNITRQVVEGDLDVAIVINPVKHPDLIMQKLGDDKVGFYVGPHTFNDNTLIFDTHLGQAQTLMRQLEKKKMRFSRHIQSSNLEVICHFLQEGLGVGILPSRVAQAVDLKLFNVKMPFFKDEIFVIYRSEFRKRPLAQDFLTMCRDSF